MKPTKTLFEKYNYGYIEALPDIVPDDRIKLRKTWQKAFKVAPIYKISDNLIKALKNIPSTNFDFIIEKIKNFNGYLVFKDFTIGGRKVNAEGVLVAINDGIIDIGFIMKNNKYFVSLCNNDLNKHGVNDLMEENIGYLVHIIYYIMSGQEEYSIKNKNYCKKRSNKKHISNRENYIVGRNFVIAVSGEEFNVRGHYRWQVCGKGNKDRKLIFIKPYRKKLTKHIVNSNVA